MTLTLQILERAQQMRGEVKSKARSLVEQAYSLEAGNTNKLKRYVEALICDGAFACKVIRNLSLFLITHYSTSYCRIP